MKIEVVKIVGAASESGWSQVHSFTPKGERLVSHGQLVTALAFKTKRELETTSFGKEIILRLQEIYYSNQSDGILKKMSQTMESLTAEFLETVELEIVMAVIWPRGGETFLYVGRRNNRSTEETEVSEGQAYLARQGQVTPLLEKAVRPMAMVSGKLENDDHLILGTAQFFKIVSEEILNRALKQEGILQTVEDLATVVHGQEENNQVAAAIIKSQLNEEQQQPERLAEVTTEEPEKKIELKTEGRVKEKGQLLTTVWQGLKEVVINLVRVITDRLVGIRRGTFRGKDISKKRKSAAVVALVLILVFVFSIVLAGRKRQTQKQKQQYQAVLEEAKYRYDEAQGLLELNPLRAKSLLIEAKKAIEDYRTEVGEDLVEEVINLEKQIDEALGQSQREYQLESATEFFDFDLVKEGFKADDWDGDENQVIVWDKSGLTAVVMDLESKASEIVIGGEAVSDGELVGMTGNWGFVVTSNNGADSPKVVMIDLDEGQVIGDEVEGDWTGINDVVGFSSNLYLLDAVEEGQIWKYLGSKGGLSSQRSYLKGDKYDLSEAVDMAIDGLVWVLFSDGTIVKYTQGVKDAFVVAGLDQAFTQPIKLFTDSDSDNLYILDQKNTRVVVVTKGGEYQSQYIWPGIAGVKDLVVREDLKKIFLLTGEKIFTIDLKD